MSKGNVLVTGGSGYIGSHTVVELLKEDYSAIVVDNMANAVENEEGFPESLKRVQKITGKDLTFYKLDIRNIDIIIFDKKCLYRGRVEKKLSGKLSINQSRESFFFLQTKSDFLFCFIFYLFVSSKVGSFRLKDEKGPLDAYWSRSFPRT